MTRQLLTHSRKQSFKKCRRAHYYGYELCIRPAVDAKALRMGRAYHAAQECLGNGGSLEQVCEQVYDAYANQPDKVEEWDWRIEEQTVIRLLCGYVWRWEGNPIVSVAVEREYALPLVNPETGRRTPLWATAGKIDGIVQLADGRLAVRDFKLLGTDISTESRLWPRMRLDSQVSGYVLAARRLGFPVDAVLYDVTKKPTIKPTDVPTLDEHGLKIIVDERGERVLNKNGSPKQSGSADNWTLLSRPMTCQEWGDKLTADITERPNYYYHRQEIPRLDDQLAEWSIEEWQIQQTIRECQLSGNWFRTVSEHTCDFCPYFGICETGINVTETLPEGFVRLDHPHPELNDVSITSPSDESTPSPSIEAGTPGSAPGGVFHSGQEIPDEIGEIG